MYIYIYIYIYIYLFRYICTYIKTPDVGHLKLCRGGLRPQLMRRLSELTQALRLQTFGDAAPALWLPLQARADELLYEADYYQAYSRLSQEDFRLLP